jgi:hypothetical protein
MTIILLFLLLKLDTGKPTTSRMGNKKYLKTYLFGKLNSF